MDNHLGGTNNVALFLNGNALGLAGGSGGFGQLFSYSQSGVEGLLNVGTNWLLIDAENDGGPGGLLFSANNTTVDGVPSSVPEPGTFGLIALGGLALAAGLRKASR